MNSTIAKKKIRIGLILVTDMKGKKYGIIDSLFSGLESSYNFISIIYTLNSTFSDQGLELKTRLWHLQKL